MTFLPTILWVLFWVPRHFGIRGNKIADELAREWTVHQFVGLELAFRVSRQNIKKMIKCWLSNQHMTMWPGLTSARRQAWELISGPSPVAETRQLSFSRIKSRVFTGLLTGHNTLRRHLYIVGLIENSLCKRWGAEEETSAHVLCESETLAIFRHTTWVPFSWTLKMLEVLRLRAVWNLIKGTSLPRLWHQSEAHTGPVKGLYASGP
jgi:hypothetical protein